MAEKYLELYKVDEIPSYRYCVYRRRDPSVSQIDARTDRGTYIEKLEEVRLSIAIGPDPSLYCALIG